MTSPFRIPTVEEFAPLENRVAAFVAVLGLMPEITYWAALNALNSCGLSVCEIGAATFYELIDEAQAQRIMEA